MSTTAAPAPKEGQRQEREVLHFTRLFAESGRTWWGNLTPAGQRRNDRRIDLLRERVRITPATKVLEVGCGAGEYTARLARLGCSIAAIDITPVLVEHAARRVPDANVTFAVMDATAPDYPAASFDLVFGKSILHHLDYRAALAAYKRLLRPGGRILFSEPNLWNPITFVALKLRSLRRRMDLSADETALRAGRIRSVLVDLGYEDIAVRPFDFLHPSTPDRLIGIVDHVGRFLERVPGLRALSGSLLISASVGGC